MTVTDAFVWEMTKKAFGFGALGSAAQKTVGALRQQAGAVGAGVGLGALGGAGIGALAGGVKSYHDAHEQGAPVGSAAARGILGGLRGAGAGAVIGAGVGGAAGLASGARGAGLARAVADRSDLLGSAARFGQRQVHGITGAVPAGAASKTEAIRAMGAGAAPARGRLANARTALADAADGKASRKALDEATAAQKAVGAAERIEELGMTSMPGVLKAYATRPADALKASLNEQWHSGGWGTRGVMMGLPVAGAAASLAAPESSNPTAPGRAERSLSALSPLVAGMGAMPIAGAVGSGLVLGKGLQAAGAGIDAIRRRRNPTPPGSPADAPAPAVERIYSDAALGRPPEGST